MHQDEKEARLTAELQRLQAEMEEKWLDQSVPEWWNGMDIDEPVDPAKTRVTLRLDSDLLRWFRKLGPGYGARINRVLRVYYCALVAGHIKAYPADNPNPRILLEAQRIIDRGRGTLD